METKEIAVKGRRNIVIVLKESSVLLDEVVAIGYGKQSRALITNSISKINKEMAQEIQMFLVTDLSEYLWGKCE